MEDALTHQSPIIDSTTKNWEVWDIASRQYVDTGVHAEGTLATYVNGILKGQNGQVVAAVAGTDYPSVATVNEKQDTLVSGTNIKTINGDSILGPGNINTSEKSKVITCTLSSGSWSNNEQVVTTFIGGTIEAVGFAYIVSPSPSDNAKWNTAGIYSLDVDANNQMTFACATTPTDDISVSILKVQVG